MPALARAQASIGLRDSWQSERTAPLRSHEGAPPVVSGHDAFIYSASDGWTVTNIDDFLTR